MLRRLVIEDYGLIKYAEIEFACASTIFTGETGSGKTMVLGAIAFALGERSGSGIVRRGQTRAVVTLEFEPGKALRRRFAEDGFALDDDEEATLSRELSESGKSTVRLNGRGATAGYVREIAPEILDIVGQHEAQRLLAPAYHVELLDRFGGDNLLQARTKVSELYAARSRLFQTLESFDRDERRLAEQHAFAKYALDEIDGAAPEAGEDDRLETRRRILNNAEKIANALRAAHEALAGDDACAQDALGAASASLAAVSDVGEPFATMANSAAALQSEVNELSVLLARELDGLEFDATELETINARLDILDTLKRKYGGSLESVLVSKDEFRASVEAFASSDQRRTALERELADASALLEQAASRLSELRHAAGQRLTKAVEPELKELALASARFGVRFEPFKEISANGAEDVEFVFAANKGEPERALSRVASGGELSRVLLALVVVLAGARGQTALVFDEIDAGIGGATANAVAVRLGRLAGGAQVVCVTHLAQIASWAEVHYVLEKHETKNATTIEVRRIEGAPERTAELARMLSGESHDVALRHARTLLEQTDERRAALQLSS